jgi:hypothetical protein
MGAHDVFGVLAIILAIATIAILIATKRVRNGWMAWLAVPVIAFLCYWVLVCLYMGYYFIRINDVR